MQESKNTEGFAMKKYSTKTTTKTNDFRKLDSERAGIDIGSSSVFVCASDTEGYQTVREYSTFTKDLESMAKWLKDLGVKSIAMESTGVYWIPVFEILDSKGFEVLLVNAHHLKNVPGRKTDVKDSQWIQQLHSYGLLNGSFRPSDDFIPLRAYARHRRQLFQRAGAHIQLMQKAFVQMNIQMQHVLSDITSKTGLSIIQAILKGERDPKQLARLRDRRCKKSEEEIAKALEGTWREEHIFTLRQAYEAYEFYHKQIHECEEKIRNVLSKLIDIKESEQTPPLFEMASGNSTTASTSAKDTLVTKNSPRKKTSYNRSPYHFDAADQVQQICGVNLTNIPGIDANTLVTIISEIGTDMSKWKTVKHFVSWLGLCPGNKISGGKVLSSKTKPCDNRVANALRLAASTLYRSQTALGAFFRRMRARLGAPKAITATAHKLAKILYCMLKYGVSYEEQGANYYEEKHKERVLTNLKKKAAELGWELVPTELT